MPSICSVTACLEGAVCTLGARTQKSRQSKEVLVNRRVARLSCWFPCCVANNGHNERWQETTGWVMQFTGNATLVSHTPVEVPHTRRCRGRGIPDLCLQKDCSGSTVLKAAAGTDSVVSTVSTSLAPLKVAACIHSLVAFSRTWHQHCTRPSSSPMALTSNAGGASCTTDSSATSPP